MFSRRTAWTRQPTPLAQLRADLQADGQSVCDLTDTNPTQQGFAYAPDVIATCFPPCPHYSPEPLGLETARHAIHRYLQTHGGQLTPDQLWIGAGTSELYAHLMHLLGDPGDCWLVPEPGYPLLDMIADTAGLSLQTYPLPLATDGYISMDALDSVRAQAPRCRAIVVVHPHNPTGHLLAPDQLEHLTTYCAAHELALVIDEVFLDYPLDRDPPLPTAARPWPCLTFTLSGLSKVALLPQAKLAWTAVTGPAQWVEEALERAALLADTYLNTATTIQTGAAQALAHAPAMQEQVRRRCRRNLSIAQQVFAETEITVRPPPGGWACLLRLPALQDDDAWALTLLKHQQVLTQPGHLFGLDRLAHGPHLVLSLLVHSDIFLLGCERLLAHVQQKE